MLTEIEQDQTDETQKGIGRGGRGSQGRARGRGRGRGTAAVLSQQPGEMSAAPARRKIYT